MPVIAAHGGGDDGPIQFADKEQLGLHRELALDVLERIVPRAGEAAGLPQGDHRICVAAFEGTDVHEVSRL